MPTKSRYTSSANGWELALEVEAEGEAVQHWLDAVTTRLKHDLSLFGLTYVKVHARPEGGGDA